MVLPEGPPSPTPHPAGPTPRDARLRAPIGLAPDGTPVHLDLKEAVDSGMGPHGLLTGSSTAVLTRDVLLNLAATHIPDEATFVLLNGAEAPSAPLTALGRLPHTETVLDRPDLLPRMIEVLEGELSRRKRFLTATRTSSHSQYLRAPTPLPPFPALILVCHEFPQLIAAHPDFLPLLRRIGWLGRARGIHLLLTATSEPEIPELTGYLSYRIATSGTSGLLQADRGLPPIPFTFRSGEGSDEGSRADAGAEVDRRFAAPPPTHRIWLPPLDTAPTLDALAGPITTDSDQPPRFADETLHGTLQVPIAALDIPQEHRQDTVWLPVTGNVAVVGGPGSGRSTFLGTAIAALALSHSAPDVRIVAPDSAATPGYQRIPLIHGRAGDPGVMRDLYTRLDVPTGDTIVLIDDWPQFWAARPDWHDLLIEIARRGPHRGVHLIATATHWSDFDPRFADHFASRLELRLADPAQSAISPAAAAAVPAAQPGRGIVGSPSGPLHFVVTRPELAGMGHDDLIRALGTDHCAECGFTYAAVSPADLPARLRAAGARYASALLESSDLRRRPEPEVWSPLEYTCHVRDMLQVQRERLALALASDNPSFTPMGRDERPLRDDYNGQDPYAVLTDFDRNAEELAAAFEALAPAELSRTGTYNWPVTATRDLLWVGRHTVHETVHHLVDITRQR